MRLFLDQSDAPPADVLECPGYCLNHPVTDHYRHGHIIVLLILPPIDILADIFSPKNVLPRELQREVSASSMIQSLWSLNHAM